MLWWGGWALWQSCACTFDPPGLDRYEDGRAQLRLDWSNLPALEDLAVCGATHGSDARQSVQLELAGPLALPLRVTSLHLGTHMPAPCWREMLPQLARLRLDAPNLTHPENLGCATALTHFEMAFLAETEEAGGTGLYWADVVAPLPLSCRCLGLWALSPMSHPWATPALERLRRWCSTARTCACPTPAPAAGAA